jgi:hypothetical protein
MRNRLQRLGVISDIGRAPYQGLIKEKAILHSWNVSSWHFSDMPAAGDEVCL